MQYFIAFLEGIITFVSPCLLPMLPVYISYFAGGENNRKRTFCNALAFIAGFTVVFLALGAFAGTVGAALQRYKTAVNLVTGGIVVIFGLNFSGILKIGFLNKTKKLDVQIKPGNIASTFLFGMIFSIGWTPCVGAFLGSALMLASERGTMAEGLLMLLLYSMGLGIPFLASALLLDRLKETFQFIKRNYLWINRICGIFLIIVGISMMTGLFGRLLAVLGSMVQ
ncbi:MAG: cytochrome c biogenesis protein CcdA [Lachnospiraceae bacterium]|nr:cytochrome c biogenesis protein CcdA [Lachnospiraceae bacterium]